MAIKQKLDLKPGIRYKGYGFINEYGEFEFSPEQTGSRQGQKKCIKTGANYSVYSTRDLLIIHITQKKKEEKIQLMNEYLQTVNETLKIIRDYEI